MRRFIIRYALLAVTLLVAVRSVVTTQADGDCIYVEHGDEMLYLRRGDGSTIVVPCGYVLHYDYDENEFVATLIDGEPLELRDVVNVSSEAPDDRPSFSSYKFDNKHNSQLFTDAECANPEVGG